MAKANPDLETLKLVLWLAGIVILLLLGVIGFFLRVTYTGTAKQFNEISSVVAKQFKEISQVVSTLSETVSSMKTIVEVIRMRQMGDQEFCRLKHEEINKVMAEHGKSINLHETQVSKLEVIDRRLNDHARRIDTHETQLAKLETRIENIQKPK